MGGSVPQNGSWGFYSREQLGVIALLIGAIACLTAGRALSDPADRPLKNLQRLPAVYELRGDVEHPGFFSFPKAQTAGALLEACGGLRNGGRPAGDLSARINTGTRVRFGPAVALADMGARARLNFFLPLSINRATAKDLTGIPGIGRKTAKAIVALRESRGRIRDLSELLEVKGIGPKKFQSLSPYLTVGG